MITAGIVSNDAIQTAQLISSLQRLQHDITFIGLQDQDIFTQKLVSTDVLIIYCTEHAFSIATDAIRAGKHVFFAHHQLISLTELSELIKYSKESNVHCGMHFQEHSNPVFREIMQTIESPLLIESHRLETKHVYPNGLSPLADILIQDIFIVLSLVNSEIKRIAATGIKVFNDQQDMANIRLTFNNGCIANLTVSSIALQPLSKMFIYQPDAYMSINFKTQQTEYITTENKQSAALCVKSSDFEHVSLLEKDIIQFIQHMDNQLYVNLAGAYRVIDVANKILKKINSFGEE